MKVGPSPDWLREALESIGQRSINNVVDVTNFVLWESGQPVHAFDLGKLGGGEIRVRRAGAGETLTTLDGEERELDGDLVVVADAERPVALAGIMGGLDSEVTEGTADVLIECAHFDPTLIGKGARKLGMHTDASHRFERGADPEAPVWASARVAQLVLEVAGGEVCAGAVDVRSEQYPPVLAGRLDFDRLQAFCGLELERSEVVRILTGLGFGLDDLDSEGGDGWHVSVPSWRYHDMRYTSADGSVYEADLFEEVLRQVSFDRVPSALPPFDLPDPGSSEAHHRRQTIRRQLAASGLAETISYAFHAGAADGSYGIWSRASRCGWRIRSPSSTTSCGARLMVGLADRARYNLHRQADAVRLFECGVVFPGPDLPEVEVVGVVMGGAPGFEWQYPRTEPRVFDLYDLKGCFESLAERFGTRLEVEPAALPGVIDGTGGRLSTPGGAVCGWIGHLDLGDAPFPVFGGELEVAPLAAGDRFVAVETPSRFPAVTMDLTLTHSGSTPWSDLRAAVEHAGQEDLVDCLLKDRYEGKGVPEGAVNTTIHFVYNSVDRSLTQEEVNERHQRLSKALEERFGWSG